MKDVKRIVLWVVFVFSLVLLWDKWQVYQGEKATFFPTAQESSVPEGGSVNQRLAPVASNSTPNNESNLASDVTANAQTTNDDRLAHSAQGDASTKSELFTVTTDVLKLTFDTRGGSLVRAELLKYPSAVDDKKNVVLFDINTDKYYVAQTGLIASDADGAKYPNQNTVMTVSGDRNFTVGQSGLDLTFTSPEVGGVKWVKTYHIKKDAYVLDVSNSVTNDSKTTQSPQLYMQLVRDGKKPEGESSHYSTYSGPAVYTEEKRFQKVSFDDIKDGKASYENQANNGYLAIAQHYFVGAWLLPSGLQRTFSLSSVNADPQVGQTYRVSMITPLGHIAPGATSTLKSRLFVGPQLENVLAKLEPGLDLVKDYGILTILAKPLFWLLSKLHSFLHNWGWSIVALVVLLKLAFYWLNARAYTSMAKMRAIQPKIKEMRERLKDNPKQIQVEMMRIYREEKVNPVGGCLPIVVQMPFFIALYWVLLSSVEMRNAPWILWIHDLSRPDPYFILPILMTITSLLQVALNPQPPDPMQAKLMWLMPLVFSVMFAFFPAGLVIYWVTNNVLTIAQQWIINSRMGVPPKFNLPKFGKKDAA